MGGVLNRGELRNEFSWSNSRETVFRECLRRYYYNYYGFWKGWEASCDELTRKIYVLKKLKSRHVWAGEVIHRCIDHSLKNLQKGIPVLALDRIKKLTLDRMRTDFRTSRAGRYWQNPKSLGLFEHEYREDLADETWKALADHVQECLDIFYAGEVFKRLCEVKREDWLEIEQFSSFRLHNVKIWAVMDC